MFLRTSTTVLLSVISFTTLTSFSLMPQIGTQTNNPPASIKPLPNQPQYNYVQTNQPNYYTNLNPQGPAQTPYVRPYNPSPMNGQGYGSTLIAPQQQQQMGYGSTLIAPTPQQQVGYGKALIVPSQGQTVIVTPQAPMVANYPTKQYAKLAKYVKRDRFVWFSEKHNKYTFFLSNNYPVQVQAWGLSFPSAESAYQAAKFANQPQLMAQFCRLDGESAKKIGRKQYRRYQRPDWYAAREAMMLEVLRAKFTQNPDLRNLLLATGDGYIVEHTKHDAFWGDGGNGRGKNRLGYLLMQVRGELGGVGVVQEPVQYRYYLR